MINPLGSLSQIKTASGNVSIYKLSALEKAGVPLGNLPISIKILLENALRHCDGVLVKEPDMLELARWGRDGVEAREIPFMPSRVLLQDFTGVPVVADLGAMRSAMARQKKDPKKINPIIPVDLVTDHSVIVEQFGSLQSYGANVDIEYSRNNERYNFLRWAQKAFNGLSIVPPGTGIVHQVNLEYLAGVVCAREFRGQRTAFPDTVVGTDSHTTMINGLGVLGWGVGGIEAEACMLSQPLYMLVPQVVGFKLTGEPQSGVTATDVVLTVTEILRKTGVVNKFVEFYGPGVAKLSLVDRATIANMSPEYGATMGFFPVDGETLNYLRMTGRKDEQIDLVERYCKEQGLWRQENVEPKFSSKLELDLSNVRPSMAGPRRPQDRVELSQVKESWQKVVGTFAKKPAKPSAAGTVAVAEKADPAVIDGSVVIAAITSCTNTSNTSVMLGAGILAKKAVEKGLKAKPYVKTSLAPGSRVVTDYLKKSGLMPYLEKLGFYLVGYGCTTCIGNSGPLPEPVAAAVKEKDLTAVAVLSGNRNFEGRINPLVKASYLASPPLVVAYAIAGTVDIDLTKEPIGEGSKGPVYLKDIWPTSEEIQEASSRSIDPKLFRDQYAQVFEGDERWRAIKVTESDLYTWNEKSTYIQEPPFFKDFSANPAPISDIKDARVLALMGDSVTTDHISPAGSIAPDSPAGRYLIEHGVQQKDFNSYGARRGNHEVMMRGTFANIRLRNLMLEESGPYTLHYPKAEKLPIYDAAMRYQAEGVASVVIAGKEYGSGSSRDWAAKGPALLGVKAAIAESFERIHRSNLVGMGVLPLEFMPGESAVTHKLKGDETFSIAPLASGLAPRKVLTVEVCRANGEIYSFKALARLDTPIDVEYYRNGGILQTVLRQIMKGNA